MKIILPTILGLGIGLLQGCAKPPARWIDKQTPASTMSSSSFVAERPTIAPGEDLPFSGSLVLDNAEILPGPVVIEMFTRVDKDWVMAANKIVPTKKATEPGTFSFSGEIQAPTSTGQYRMSARLQMKPDAALGKDVIVSVRKSALPKQ